MDTSQVKIPPLRILGEIPNPYKLSNAQLAMEKLKSSNSRITMPTTIRTTSKYVVFKPQTERQADSLLTKTDLELFIYPLHLEIEGDLEEYREPSLSSPEQPDWFYTVVKANFQFPADIPYQVLEDLYIPYDDENIANAQREVLPEYEEWLDEFERQAEIAAGLPETETNQRRGRWHPSGRIQVFDNTLFVVNNGVIPVHGAKVRIRDGVLFFTTLTDANGNFRFSQSRRNKVNYSIVWEREDYIIKDMNVFRRWNPVRPLYNFSRAAFLNGPKIKGEWNITITDRKQSYFATIHRAACDYYYHTPFGLQPPPKFPEIPGQLSIAAYLREGSNHDGYFDSIVGIFFGQIGPGIAIFDADRMKIDTYATTIHELGHAVHFILRGRNPHAFGRLTHCELRESWAIAVEWAITSFKYRFFLGGNQPFSYRGGFRDRTRNNEQMLNGYTPFMIDLVDDDNQLFFFSSGPRPDLFPNDEVQGFSVKDCENALRGNVRNFGAFYGRITALPISQSQLPQLDTLFEFYNTIPYNCSGSNQQPNTKGGE